MRIWWDTVQLGTWGQSSPMCLSPLLIGTLAVGFRAHSHQVWPHRNSMTPANTHLHIHGSRGRNFSTSLWGTQFNPQLGRHLFQFTENFKGIWIAKNPQVKPWWWHTAVLTMEHSRLVLVSLALDPLNGAALDWDVPHNNILDLENLVPPKKYKIFL